MGKEVLIYPLMYLDIKLNKLFKESGGNKTSIRLSDMY